MSDWYVKVVGKTRLQRAEHALTLGMNPRGRKPFEIPGMRWRIGEIEEDQIGKHEQRIGGKGKKPLTH